MKKSNVIQALTGLLSSLFVLFALPVPWPVHAATGRIHVNKGAQVNPNNLAPVHPASLGKLTVGNVISPEISLSLPTTPKKPDIPLAALRPELTAVPQITQGEPLAAGDVGVFPADKTMAAGMPPLQKTIDRALGQVTKYAQEEKGGNPLRGQRLTALIRHLESLAKPSFHEVESPELWAGVGVAVKDLLQKGPEDRNLQGVLIASERLIDKFSPPKGVQTQAAASPLVKEDATIVLKAHRGLMDAPMAVWKLDENLDNQGSWSSVGADFQAFIRDKDGQVKKDIGIDTPDTRNVFRASFPAARQDRVGAVLAKRVYTRSRVEFSKHFMYQVTGQRAWTRAEVLDLLERCLVHYRKLFGRSAKTPIIVYDAIGPIGAYNLGKVFIQFQSPRGFGKTLEEKELIQHFIAHELFHSWVGGYTASESQGDAVEGLTMFLANRTLYKLGVTSPDFMERQRKKIIEDIVRGSYTRMRRYYLAFEKLQQRRGEAVVNRLARELERRLRHADSEEDAGDIAPILKKYLGRNFKTHS